MRVRKTAALLAMAAVLGAGALAGCSDSDSSEASTPAGAETIPNTAIQTDSEGATVTAPAESTPAETAPAETGGGDTGGGEEVAGDATAGKATFEGVCQGCHANGGQEAGVGPKLAGAGLTADAVNTIIQNGQGAMPGGLVPEGPDRDNVVAYVVSIQ